MSDFTITWTTEYQTIDGFGASTAFASPFTSVNADFLFTTAGIGLSIMRDQISSTGWPHVLPLFPLDSQSDEIDADFTVLQSCVARGVAVWANIWWFPTAWTGGSGTGTLDVAHYGDATTLITTYLDRAWAAGVPIRAIGFNNEPDITPSGYNQTAWTTTQSTAFVKNNLYTALQIWGAANPTWQAATGLTAPGIVVSQVANWANLGSWITAFEGDSSALSKISYYGTHQYFGGTAYSTSGASKPVWQTESYDQSNPSWTLNLTDGLVIAQQINDALTIGNATAWHAWWVESVWNLDNQGLIGNNGDGTSNGSITSWNNPAFPKRAFALGNYSKFIRPGYKRIDVAGSVSGMSVTAFKNNSTSKITIVIINNSGSSATISFTLNSANFGSSLSTFITSSTTSDVIGTDGNLSPGSVSNSVPANITPVSNQFSVKCVVGVTTLIATAGNNNVISYSGRISFT
jgi:glucuronoarabinoxylan endo-1,4-beta-xylanase